MFKKYKKNRVQKENKNLRAQDPTNKDNEIYNTAITMAELESTLENNGRSAPGNDSTTYEIIQNCPKEFKKQNTNPL